MIQSHTALVCIRVPKRRWTLIQGLVALVEGVESNLRKLLAYYLFLGNLRSVVLLDFESFDFNDLVFVELLFLLLVQLLWYAAQQMELEFLAF